MQWKKDLVAELKLLESGLAARSSDLEKKVDMMEATSKEREGERKNIFLKEMKKLLVILNEVDKKVTKDLKTEAFDNIRSMNKLKCELKALEDELLTSASSNLEAGEVIQSLNNLKSEVSILEESFPASSLSLSVANSPEQMVFLTNTIKAAVYVKTPVLDPHHYSLDCSAMFTQAASKDSLMELRLHCSLPTRKFSPLVLSKLVLSLSCPDGRHFQSRRVIEEGTVAELIKKKKAFVSTPTSIMIQVKKPKNLVVTLEVKLLETDVLNSPKVFSFFSTSLDTTAVQDLTRLDTTGTGQLCQADLDITEIDYSRSALSLTNPVPLISTKRYITPSQTRQTTSSSSVDPFGSPHSPLQPTGPTPPKLCRQSSNISESPSEPSDCLTYFSPLDSTNPHLLLNASLAPGNQTLDTTYLPDPCWDDSKWCPSTSSANSQAADTTLWEVPTSPPVPSLFLSSQLQYESLYRAREDTLSTTRTQLALLAPHSITLYQGFYLVSEPGHDRVGVYTTTDMQYLGLLGKGEVQFKSPTSLLSLSGGGLVLLDKNKMNIFSQNGHLVAEFPGRFHGLTEGEDEEIFTYSGKDRNIVRLVQDHGIYRVQGRINLRVIKEFTNWKNLSKPRHIAYSMGRLHLSDKGLHKLLLVDLKTGDQTAFGYFGEGVGQFRRPAGMVVDKEGNLLVVDEGNNRVQVYTGSGNFVRIASLGQEGLDHACGISVFGDTIMLACMGNSDGRGGLVKYKIDKLE